MLFDWLLFDLDETLMDFKSASNEALKASFIEFDLPQDKATLEIYHEVNSQVWREFEEEKISVNVLISQRMQRFLDRLAVDHVASDKLNDFYLDQLARRSKYYPGTEDVLEDLKNRGYQMAIVTNGLTRVQRYRWENTSLSSYFQHLFISQEIGKPKPHAMFFDHVHFRINRPQRHRVLVIGDNPESDIKGARNFGYKSCWIERENHRLEEPKSDHKIKSLTELHRVLGHD